VFGGVLPQANAPSSWIFPWLVAIARRCYAVYEARLLDPDTRKMQVNIRGGLWHAQV
jgi:hypothetical protein